MERTRQETIARLTQRRHSVQSKLDRGYDDYLEGRLSIRCYRTARLIAEVSVPLTLSRSTCCRRGSKLEIGGEGGIRTHVPVTRQDAFEAPPLRPLRYLSG